ncbi:Cell division protein ftsW [Borrelia coriaceae ATCC 43381]|uniref:Probable peptidoglycan glycosyltransferase FtsW n=1 Tax=Borrelia coriaceae ATCC 43381 TaxID=1408429 RepID=W5SZK2_9SPIR|nr:Cell division protein ftsW [Borrelia coriaceae ATCC 43381]
MFVEQASLRKYYLLILWSLVAYGLIIFYTSSFFLSLELTGDPNFLFLMRLKYLFLSFMVFFFFERISLDILKKIVSIILLVTFILVLATFFSPSISGAQRWIFVKGVSIQPSEIFKVSFTIYLSSYLSKFRLKLDNNVAYWLKPMLIFGIFWLCIILQNDYSTAIYFAYSFFYYFICFWNVIGVHFCYFTYFCSNFYAFFNI